MCFSPLASFTAGTVLSAVGGVTLRKARTKSELPFASIPLLFGMQQLTEGVIWLSFGHPALLSVMTFVFLMFSHILWPTYIPLAAYLLETVRWRRRVLAVFVMLGCVVSCYFLYYLLKETVHAEIVRRSIAYVSPHFFVYFVFSPYSVATCASCLFSSHRWVNFFGVATFLSAVAAYRLYELTFVSVWCFFAALISGVVFMHFYTGNSGEHH